MKTRQAEGTSICEGANQGRPNAVTPNGLATYRENRRQTPPRYGGELTFWHSRGGRSEIRRSGRWRARMQAARFRRLTRLVGIKTIRFFLGLVQFSRAAHAQGIADIRHGPVFGFVEKTFGRLLEDLE